MRRYYVGLGSNLGNRLGYLIGACDEIAKRVERWAVSSVYETEPVGGPEQPPFLNAVAAVDTDLSPISLLDALQEIEDQLGRERTVRWGPRTLDLDIVAWDGPAYSDDRVVIPHPRAHERAFVLEPLAESWPEARVGHGATAGEALGDVDRSGVDRLARHWLPPVPRAVPNALVGGQMLILTAVGLGVVMGGSLPDRFGLRPVLGLAAIGIGAILTVWSARLLGPGMTASPVPASEARLVETGPYRFVRHPIYTGVLLVALGAAVFSGSWSAAMAALALGPYLWLKTAFEERQLRLRFSGYRSYRKRVRWRLVPYVT